MKRLRSKKLHKVIFSRPILAEERQICVRYGLSSKKKDLGRYKFMVKKYHGLGRREGISSMPYQLAQRALIRKGILVEGQDMNSLRIESFLDRRLLTIVSKTYERPLSEARNLIVAGKIWYRSKRLRSPGAIIPIGLEKEIKLNIRDESTSRQK